MTGIQPHREADSGLLGSLSASPSYSIRVAALGGAALSGRLPRFFAGAWPHTTHLLPLWRVCFYLAVLPAQTFIEFVIAQHSAVRQFVAHDKNSLVMKSGAPPIAGNDGRRLDEPSPVKHSGCVRWCACGGDLRTR